jgi:hypothetical protein
MKRILITLLAALVAMPMLNAAPKLSPAEKAEKYINILDFKVKLKKKQKEAIQAPVLKYHEIEAAETAKIGAARKEMNKAVNAILTPEQKAARKADVKARKQRQTPAVKAERAIIGMTGILVITEAQKEQLIPVYEKFYKAEAAAKGKIKQAHEDMVYEVNQVLTDKQKEARRVFGERMKGNVPQK